MGNDERREKIRNESREIYDLDKSYVKNEIEKNSIEREIEENPISSLFTPHKIITKAVYSIKSEIIKKKIEKKEVDVRSLIQMEVNEEKFCKNVNLDDYRNEDGTFNVYRVERPLNFKDKGEKLDDKNRKLHHEGVAIGNGKNMFYSDYGVKEGDLKLRFWDSKENKEDWKRTTMVGKSNCSNYEVKEILVGEKSENWRNPNGYTKIFNNCQHYTNKKIKELTKES